MLAAYSSDSCDNVATAGLRVSRALRAHVGDLNSRLGATARPDTRGIILSRSMAAPHERPLRRVEFEDVVLNAFIVV
jgi:hypothetical protein